MEKLVFDGKEKRIYSTDDPQVLIIRFKDDTTAYGGIKRAVFKGKGELNCRISGLVFEALKKAGIATHYIGPESKTGLYCRNVEMIPLHVIVRNYIAGSTADMLGMEAGFKPQNVVYELRYDNEGLGDPLINDHHAVALGIVSYEQLDRIYDMVRKANDVLVDLFHRAGIRLVDYRVEMGVTSDGEIIIADEISPDTCRMWDDKTGECLDKDRFRHDLGAICDSYRKVLNGLEKAMKEDKQ